MSISPDYLRQLVGNPDAYAIQQEDGSYKPVRKPLLPKHLEDHLAGKQTVGTYINHGDKARTLVFDIDSGDMAEASAIRKALLDLGMTRWAVGIEFSGKKGYHAWVLVEDYVPASDLRRLGRAALATAGVQCEVFPKQDEARDLGNLVKLPGGVHRVSGKWSRFIGRLPRPVSKKILSRVLDALPAISVSAGASTRPDPFPCLAKIQEGVAEGGRNNSIFHLAVMCQRMGLSHENTRLVVESVNAEASPPLDDEELANILSSSQHSGPLCRQLSPELHCGDLCILEKVQGLHTRPGRLKFADVGEAVVVQVQGRTEDIIRFEHQDLEGSGKGTVK